MNGDNKLQCGGCRSLQSGTKRVMISEAPNVLTMTLKRFGARQNAQGRFEATKDKHHVAIPERLDLTPYMHPDHRNGNNLYNLYGMVIHMGNSAQTGHYISYVKKNGVWYRFDDSTVTAVTTQHVLQQYGNETPYVVFFEKEQPNAVPRVQQPVPQVLAARQQPVRVAVAATNTISKFDTDVQYLMKKYPNTDPTYKKLIQDVLKHNKNDVRAAENYIKMITYRRTAARDLHAKYPSFDYNTVFKTLAKTNDDVVAAERLLQQEKFSMDVQHLVKLFNVDQTWLETVLKYCNGDVKSAEEFARTMINRENEANKLTAKFPQFTIEAARKALKANNDDFAKVEQLIISGMVNSLQTEFTELTRDEIEQALTDSNHVVTSARTILQQKVESQNYQFNMDRLFRKYALHFTQQKVANTVFDCDMDFNRAEALLDNLVAQRMQVPTAQVQIQNLGFTAEQAQRCLNLNQGDVSRAADYCFMIYAH